MLLVYRETSDSGLSDIGTQHNTPLYKGRFSRFQIIGFSIIVIPPKRSQLVYRDKTPEFILSHNGVLIIEVLCPCVIYRGHNYIHACVIMILSATIFFLPLKGSPTCGSFTIGVSQALML